MHNFAWHFIVVHFILLICGVMEGVEVGQAVKFQSCTEYWRTAIWVIIYVLDIYFGNGSRTVLSLHLLSEPTIHVGLLLLSAFWTYYIFNRVLLFLLWTELLIRDLLLLNSGILIQLRLTLLTGFLLLLFISDISMREIYYYHSSELYIESTAFLYLQQLLWIWWSVDLFSTRSIVLSV